MSENPRLKIHKPPNLQNPSLLVGWSQDIGKLGPKVIDYLNKKLGAEEFGELEPEAFSSFGGVQIEDNVIQFPESKFYSCPKNNLLIFESSPPRYEHYKFLNSVLDFAQHCDKVNELYTLGGIVSLMSHTAPRRILTVVNQPESKEMLARHGLETAMDYESPHGQMPSLSGFLLWLAKRRNITGVNLWTEVPFYLAAVEDLKAIKYTLGFLNKRFELNLDFGDLDLKIRQQNERIKQLREQNPEVNKYIEMLERGIMLSEDENEELAKEMTKFLEGG